MGYLHINNLYKDQTILLHKECYALEKVHGTSAHVAIKDGQLAIFSGGESHERFAALFDQASLLAGLATIGPDIAVFGEAYGGKQQGMSATYGPNLCFIAFDVRAGEGSWFNVPDAEQVVLGLGLEFVPYTKIPTDLGSIDRERDADSIVAVRRGVGPGKIREGVVLRPLEECTVRNGRLICKHKRDEFMETATPRKVDPGKLVVEANANHIALEWVTETRLQHVLDKLPEAKGIEDTGKVIAAMWEDVSREAAGEIEVNAMVRGKCNARSAQLWKQKLASELKETV